MAKNEVQLAAGSVEIAKKEKKTVFDVGVRLKDFEAVK